MRSVGCRSTTHAPQRAPPVVRAARGPRTRRAVASHASVARAHARARRLAHARRHEHHLNSRAYLAVALLPRGGALQTHVVTGTALRTAARAPPGRKAANVDTPADASTCCCPAGRCAARAWRACDALQPHRGRLTVGAAPHALPVRSRWRPRRCGASLGGATDAVRTPASSVSARWCALPRHSGCNAAACTQAELWLLTCAHICSRALLSGGTISMLYGDEDIERTRCNEDEDGSVDPLPQRRQRARRRHTTSMAFIVEADPEAAHAAGADGVQLAVE